MEFTHDQRSILVSVKRIKQVNVLLFLLNIFFLVGTWLHNNGVLAHANSRILRTTAQLNLADENVIASWFSSMLLLLVAVSAGCCYIADNQGLSKLKDRVLNTGWMVFMFIFLVLSFDEMGSFHEVIGDTEMFKVLGGNSGWGGWLIFYLLIALVGLFMMAFFILKFFRNGVALSFAVLGVLLFLSNPLQENYEIDSWHNAADPNSWKRPVIFLLLEEGSELFASFCLFFSFTTYLKNSLAKSQPGITAGNFTISFPGKKRCSMYGVVLVIVSCLCMFIVKLNTGKPDPSVSGIPQNWFPSALSFMMSLGAIYLYYMSRHSIVNYRYIYLLTALLGILVSVNFGGNMYSYDGGIFGVFSLFLVGVLALTGIIALLKFNFSGARIIFITWVAFILIAYFTRDFY